MEGNKLHACFHLPAPCTLNAYIYICERKWCKGLCTSSPLYNTLPLHSKDCRMICVQMKIISAAEHVRRDGGGKDHWCCLLGAALGDVSLWIWKLWEVSCWWQVPRSITTRQPVAFHMEFYFTPSPACVESAVRPRWSRQSENVASGVFLV